MATFKVTDPTTGLTVKLTGESPPTEQELEQIFSSVSAQKGISVSTTPQQPEQPGLGSRVVSGVGQAWNEATNPDYSMSRKAVRSLGTLGEVAGDVMVTGVKTAYDYAFSPDSKKTLSGIFDYLKNSDIVKAQAQTFGDVGRAWGAVREAAPETATDIEKGLMIPNLIPAAQAGRLVAPVAAGAAKMAGRGVVAGAEGIGSLIRPRPTPNQAMGQVLQSRGKTPAMIEKDLAKGKQALSAIDLKDVKTYAELSRKIDAKIPEIARQVDAELAKDPNLYRMQDLATTQATKGGAAVTSNYVEDALNHLRELYTKTGDAVKAGNIDEIIQKAQTQGLTKKEVNDIARMYGAEFKAFNQSTGVPLTSINAQTYENVRSGLKEVARRGLSDTAKELDSTMSALYNTKRLIDKNVDAANRLRQKIDERGLGEKIGRRVWDAIDIATAGVAKGALLKMIPRGLGYKVKNYIDLEESLTRNLKIINDELKKAGAATGSIKAQTGAAQQAGTLVPPIQEQTQAPQQVGTLVPPAQGTKPPTLTAPAQAQASAPVQQPALVSPPNVSAFPELKSSVVQDTGKFPVQRVAVNDIKANPQELQFKLDVNAEGVQKPLKGEWNELASGNLLLWEAKDGKIYVANGHHRLAHAKQKGVESVNAQVLREADGYSINDARRVAAEANILEGKGTVYDHAEYFRLQPEIYTPDMARSRGLSGRGYTIGTASTPDTYAQFRSKAISPEAAEQISGTAPKNPALQNAGVKYSLTHPKAEPYEISNFIKALSTIEGRPTSGDLFGWDDSALKAAEKMGKAAASEIKSLRERITAVQGAAKRPEIARKMGVDVNDPASVTNKITQLKAEIETWQHWETNPLLVNELKRITGLLPQDAAASGELGQLVKPRTLKDSM